jgi:predicted RecB family nuclease
LPVNFHTPDVEGADGQSSALPILASPSMSLVPLPSLASNGSGSTAGAAVELWITDELLFNYQRCNRRAFLDAYGDRIPRDPPTDYLMKLRQDSFDHQLVVLGEQPNRRPEYSRKDWLTGAKSTLALMQQGVERIVNGVVWVRREDGVNLVSCPNLLIKQPGQSSFGDWLYVSTDIKLGKRPKMDYQVTATFHAYVLASVQGVWPETSWLVLRSRNAYAVDLVEILPKMQVVLDECVETLRSPTEPEVFITHSRCDLCQWFSHCYEIAQDKQHLSLLPGVTPSRYVYLKELELLTVEDLIDTPPEQLAGLPGFGPQVAHKLVQQAQSKLENRALPRQVISENTPLLSADELPTEPVELYFDIEAAPDRNLVYLHGVLVVDRQQQTETFHALLADRPEDEGAIWEQFWELVWQYPTAPIFHFCPYEVQTVKRLAEYYGAPSGMIEPLLDRFVDLHERVTRSVTLPVESYALKHIARWIGFHWRDQGANGAQSIFWYAQWLETGDRAFLDSILRYNEDDCRATYSVKNWLADFVQATLP